MSQQPPTGPGSTPGDGDVPDGPRKPEGAGGEPTESFARSPDDVPHADRPELDGTTGYPVPPAYGQAPDPSRAYGSSTTEPAPETDEGGGRRWVVPVVVVAVILLVAGGIAVALFLGGDDDEAGPVAPASPTTEPTTGPGETASPTQGPTATPSPESTGEATAEPTEEPAAALLEDLDESVAAGDLTFTLTEEGFTPEDVEGAVEAYSAQYVSGDEEIDMLATYWPDNEAADEYAAQLVERLDGQQVQTGSTYTNDMGTFWAYLVEGGQGTYVWTTDRGHVLQVTGSPDYVTSFYSGFPL